MLCSSLVESIQAQTKELQIVASSEAISSYSTERLEGLVREEVRTRDEKLDQYFGFTVRSVPNARPTRFGFAGKKLVTNFGLLVPGKLARQVKDAKAKLWDLAQLQDDTSADLIGNLSQSRRLELFIHRVRKDDPQYSEKQIQSEQEAMLELEGEADKKNIRCRDFRSTAEMAVSIVEAEQAA
jgi:hypothetical protein